MTANRSHDILLESGTNELEVLVFTLAGQKYGVNVAKVREVLEPVPITAVPEAHFAVVGVFQLRECLVAPRRCLSQNLRLEILDLAPQQLEPPVAPRVAWKSIGPVPAIKHGEDREENADGQQERYDQKLGNGRLK